MAAERNNYHNIPAVSQSMLKAFGRDPDKCYQQYVSRELPMDKATASMKWGTLLENWLFKRDSFLVIPNSVLSSSGSKSGNAWKQFASDNDGKELVKEEEVASLKKAEANILKNERAKDILFRPDHQSETWPELFWKDPETGLACKCQLDRVLNGALIADLKTAASVDADFFSRQAYSLGYHIQAAWYVDAWQECRGEKLDFVFVTVKNSETYSVRTRTLSERFVDRGRRKYRELIRQVAACYESGVWAEDGWDEIIEVDEPRWASYEDDYTLEAPY